MTEIWLPVVGFEDFYEVSNLGRVRGLDRIVPRHQKQGVVMQRVRGQMIRPTISALGYKFLSLHRNGHYKATVHSLVALAFLGPRPFGQDVCHNDGNPSNCALTNLRYGTRVENCEDKKKHGTQPCGEGSHLAKLTEEDVIAIRMMKGRCPQRELAADFGVARQTISKIQLGIKWSHVKAGLTR